MSCASTIDGEPAEEILRYGEETHADLIVVGTHGRELIGRWLLGSVAEAMLRRAPCPVLTLHAGARDARPVTRQVLDNTLRR